MALPSFYRVPVLLTVLLTLFVPRAHSQGLTADACRRDLECVEPRRCLEVRSLELCEQLSPTELALSSGCSCRPPSLIQCISSDVCPEGEICAARASSPRFICISEAVVDASPSFVPATTPNPTEGGLTLDSCLQNKDCLAPRICLFTAGARDVPCVGRPDCSCHPPVFDACDSDTDCQEGEVCGVDGIDICVSRNVPGSGQKTLFPNPTGVADPEVVEDILDKSDPPSSLLDSLEAESSEGCIAERHMEGVKGVYDVGRHAKVMCDSFGNCATRGHFVVYRGRGMMMQRYCEIVGCVDRVMKVNSPTWERGLRLDSRSDELKFTAFAARYETSAEEVMLAAAVKVGL